MKIIDYGGLGVVWIVDSRRPVRHSTQILDSSEMKPQTASKAFGQILGSITLGKHG